MKILTTDELKEGMKFTQDVYLDDDTILVPANIALRDKDINRLHKWGITSVKTEGEVLGGTLKKVTDSDAEWMFPSDNDVEAQYVDFLERISSLLDDIGHRRPVQTDNIRILSQELINSVEKSRFEWIRLVLRGDLVQNDSNYSALNTAIISTNVGIRMKLGIEALQNLVIGAFLHDVGMSRIPEEIMSKASNLTKKELEEMKTHPLHSYKIIFNELRLNKDIAIIALQHHERWDGEGYPRHISGKDISSLSQIVSVADAFEAMISERPYRNSMIGYQAMKNILNDNSRRFDPEIIKVFIRSMGIYPVGSIVMLSDSSVGRVITTNDDSPLRPELLILVDSDNKEYRDDSGPVVDLLKEPTLFIVKAINIKDLLKKA